MTAEEHIALLNKLCDKLAPQLDRLITQDQPEDPSGDAALDLACTLYDSIRSATECEWALSRDALPGEYE